MSNVVGTGSLANPLQIDDRITRIPKRPYQKVGYGLNDYRSGDIAEAITFGRVLAFLDKGELIAPPSLHIEDLGTVGSMFNLVQSASKSDWLFKSHELGYPSHILARRIAKKFSELQMAIIHDDMCAMKNAVKQLHEESVPEMIENYLEAARGKPMIHEEDWAYIAWSSRHRQKLSIGAGSGTILEVLDRLENNDNYDCDRYGILSAWLVYDVQDASETIEDALDEFQWKMGRYVANDMDIGRARDAVESALIATDNMVLSPWHVDDNMAWKRLGFNKDGYTGQSSSADMIALPYRS